MKPLNERLAYDEESPLTGNLRVLIDIDEETGIISKLCMDSGFTSNTLMADTPEFWESLKQHFLIGSIFAIKDTKGVIWIPSAQASSQAAIYPIQHEETGELVWQVTPAIKSPDRPEEDFELDFDASKRFAKLEYEKAFGLFAQWSNLETV